jgi:hypothetical protein
VLGIVDHLVHHGGSRSRRSGDGLPPPAPTPSQRRSSSPTRSAARTGARGPLAAAARVAATAAARATAAWIRESESDHDDPHYTISTKASKAGSALRRATGKENHAGGRGRGVVAGQKDWQAEDHPPVSEHPCTTVPCVFSLSPIFSLYFRTRECMASVARRFFSVQSR